MKFLLLMIGLSSFMFAEVLKISYSRSSDEPYVLIDKRQLTGGVLKELMDAFGKESGMHMEYVLTPKRDQAKALQEGVIDGLCLIHPDDKIGLEDYQWSIPLYIEEDILVVLKENLQNINSIDSLVGHKVGTVNSHYYANIDPFFKNKSIQRIENKTSSNNINQLRFGIIDAVIDTRLAVGHTINQHKSKVEFVAQQVLEQQEIYCAFRKDMEVSLTDINTAFEGLKRRGVIDKIIKKYRASL